MCPAPCWAPAAGPVDICAPRLGHVTVSRRRKALHQILAQPLTDREPGQAPLRLWKASFLSHMGLWEASALSPEPGVVLWAELTTAWAAWCVSRCLSLSQSRSGGQGPWNRDMQPGWKPTPSHTSAASPPSLRFSLLCVRIPAPVRRQVVHPDDGVAGGLYPVLRQLPLVQLLSALVRFAREDESVRRAVLRNGAA